MSSYAPLIAALVASTVSAAGGIDTSTILPKSEKFIVNATFCAAVVPLGRTEYDVCMRWT